TPVQLRLIPDRRHRIFSRTDQGLHSPFEDDLATRESDIFDRDSAVEALHFHDLRRINIDIEYRTANCNERCWRPNAVRVRPATQPLDIEADLAEHQIYDVSQATAPVVLQY